MAAAPDGPTAWIVVGPDTDPLVSAHLEHPGATVIGETHDGDDWREALAWARARTDQVYLRFDYSDTTWWAGAGPPPDRDPALQPLPDRPTVFVDDWIAELRALRGRLAELEARVEGAAQTWTAYSPPRLGRSVRSGSGRAVDWALAAQPGVHPELLVSSQEPPGRVTLTVQAADLDARVRWLRDLGGTVLRQTAGAALVEDPEGNRARLLALPPVRPGSAASRTGQPPYRG